MSCFRIAVLLTAAISPIAAHAQAKQMKLLQPCEAQVTARFKQWRVAPVKPEVAKWAKDQHENPTMASGDFDGNGRTDVALLIQDGPVPEPDYPGRLDSLHIAVCLDRKTSIKLHVIDDLYCGDGITRARKGHRYYDYEKQSYGKYSEDGVSAYCFEKAGATYVFENGEFRQIVDSD